MAPNSNIQIRWDHGTAYDFFSSLHVLHFPDDFGLRGAWAAGVRSRLTNEARDFFEIVINNFNIPLNWVHELAAPKDASTALLALKRIPVGERLAALKLSPVDSDACFILLAEVMSARIWEPAELNQLVRLWRNARPNQRVVPGPVSEERAAKVLDMYADPVGFGEKYLNALETYYQVFFSEEEKRIAPKLETALEKARKAVSAQGGPNFLQELAEETKITLSEQVETVVLAPSYWCSPVYQQNVDQKQVVILFGARPKEESLVPGEIVPEELLLRLKAMTDPTRMRILRYLLQEQLTPAELARRLRLRAPTVTHHLHTLKSSGMVHFVKKGKNEHLYYAKMDSIKETYVLLKDFLEQDVSVVEGFNFSDSEMV
jgi:DNA-binding transcriptional ArsR family regulator